MSMLAMILRSVSREFIEKAVAAMHTAAVFDAQYGDLKGFKWFKGSLQIELGISDEGIRLSTWTMDSRPELIVMPGITDNRRWLPWNEVKAEHIYVLATLIEGGRLVRG